MEQVIVNQETVEVESFLAIEKCKVELRELTVFIGPQASGKSIIAKIAFFGRQYLNEAITQYAASQDKKVDFNKGKANEFYELFPGSDAAEHRFNIVYTLGLDSISISKVKGNRSLRIKANSEFEKKTQKIHKDYLSFLENRKEENRQFFDDGWYSFTRKNPKYSEMNVELPRVLHIPATRAFFSAVRKNFFSFLSESKTIDPLLVQFGRFLEFAKSEYTGEGIFSRTGGKAQRDSGLESVISGEFIREKDEDLIRTKWGKVSLQSSSSGQQEALPLLLALLHYPNSRWKNDLIIIEEPEAHLFPRAQKAIVEMIVRVVEKTSCKVMITTHSPYILACLNNHLQGSDLEGRENTLSASCYFIEDGRTQDMFDYEDSLIDMSKLDSVSEDIASEFIKITSKKNH